MYKTMVIAAIMGIAPPPASWGHDGFGPGNTRYNPDETVINAKMDSLNSKLDLIAERQIRG